MQKMDKTKYEMWKMFGSFCITLLTAFSTIITIINGMDKTKEWLSTVLGSFLSQVFIYANLIVLLPFGIVVVVVSIISYFTLRYRKRIGTHAIPCTLISLYHFKIANRNNKLLKSIHKDIYHNFYKLKDDMHMRRIRTVEEANKGLEDLLYDIHKAILKSLGLDLTINVKRLIMDRENNLCLIPFIHFRNMAERITNNPRTFNYCYYIEPECHTKLSKYATMARKYCQKNDMPRKYEVNSIFTYLITKRERYWMSNDLTVDEKVNDFFTSSDNYPEFYKSMAAFSITPPNSGIIPEGIIIFDTKKKGKFSEEECVNIFGYIAHLFYELIIEYNYYESRKK